MKIPSFWQIFLIILLRYFLGMTVNQMLLCGAYVSAPLTRLLSGWLGPSGEASRPSGEASRPSGRPADRQERSADRQGGQQTVREASRPSSPVAQGLLLPVTESFYHSLWVGTAGPGRRSSGSPSSGASVCLIGSVSTPVRIYHPFSSCLSVNNIRLAKIMKTKPQPPVELPLACHYALEEMKMAG